jgi:hypothetical protein
MKITRTVVVDHEVWGNIKKLAEIKKQSASSYVQELFEEKLNDLGIEIKLEKQ